MRNAKKVVAKINRKEMVRFFQDKFVRRTGTEDSSGHACCFSLGVQDELRKLRSVCDPVVVDEVNWLAVEVKYGPLPIPAEDTAPVNFQRGSLGEHVLDYKPKRRQLDFHVEGLRRVFDEWSSAFGETHKRCVNWAPVFTPVPSRATFFEAKWGYSRDAADGVGVPKMAFPGREKATGRPPLTKTLEWRDKVGHAGFSIL